jgi:outer membrane lipoprotein SlyB
MQKTIKWIHGHIDGIGFWVLLLAASVLVPCCATAQLSGGQIRCAAAGRVFETQESDRFQAIQSGTVEAARPVVIKQQATMIDECAVAGIVVAPASPLGSTVGAGRRLMVQIKVPIGVAASDPKLADAVFSRDIQSMAIVVHMDDNRMLTIVQEADKESSALRRGDRVSLVEGQQVRVARLHSQ